MILIPTQRTRRIKPLRKAPLALIRLRRTTRNVICSCITQDIVQGVPLGDILRRLADDDGQLGLVVARVVALGDLGQDGGCGPGVCEGGGGLQEYGRNVGEREVHLCCVGDVLISYLVSQYS
jgi:hypothetical protein